MTPGSIGRVAAVLAGYCLLCTVLLIGGIAVRAEQYETFYRIVNPWLPTLLYPIGYAGFALVLLVAFTVGRHGRRAVCNWSWRFTFVAAFFSSPLLLIECLRFVGSGWPPIPQADTLVHDCGSLAREFESGRMLDTKGKPIDPRYQNEVPREHWPPSVLALKPFPHHVRAYGDMVTIIQSAGIGGGWGMVICLSATDLPHVDCPGPTPEPQGRVEPTEHPQIFRWEVDY